MTLANARELARCGADLHDALHVAPDFSGVEVALGVAHHVQPLNGVLTSILRQILVRLVGLHLLGCMTQQLHFRLHSLILRTSTATGIRFVRKPVLR